MQYCRHDACRTVGRCSDHAPAVGIFLVDRQGIQVDPVKYRQRVAQVGLRVLAELAVQCRCPAFDLEPARQDALVPVAGCDAILHHLPDPQQTRSGFGLGAPGRLVGQHHLAHRQLLRGAMPEQLLGSLERVGEYGAVLDDAVLPGGLFVDHETAAHRVVLPAADLQAGGIEGAEDHAVGVVCQRLADHRQVLLLDEGDGVFTEQVQVAAFTDCLQAGGNGFGVDGIGVLAFQAKQYRLVAAMAFARGTQ
ncbi:hypothetical protein D3C78_1062590 [compost metagenome]